MIKKLIEMINAKSKRIFILMPANSFGNRAEEIYFGLLKVRRENKKLFLINTYSFFWKWQIRKGNNELLRIESEYLYGDYHDLLHISVRLLMSLSYFVKRSVFFGFYAISRILGLSENNKFKNIILKIRKSSELPIIGWEKLWIEEDTDLFDLEKAKTMDWEKELNCDLHLKSSLKDVNLEREYLFDRLQLPIDSWFVCVHVREGGFFNDYSTSIARNADITNYFNAFKRINDRGGYIIRIGDPAMKKLPDHPMWIDYAHHNNKSERLDILLIKNCSFYIGSFSGPMDVAALLGKTIITINASYIDHCCWYKKGSLCLPKKILRKKDDHILSFVEFVKERDPLNFQGVGNLDYYEYIENTSDDIDSTIKFFLERSSVELTKEQIKANEIYKHERLKIFSNIQLYSDKRTDALQKYRWASRILALNGGFCPFYLKRNGFS